MGNRGPGNSEAKHERAWRYLDEQDFDVALLQETRKPPAWAYERWSPVWKPKYASNPSGRVLWGCAAVGRSIELQEIRTGRRLPVAPGALGVDRDRPYPDRAEMAGERPPPRKSGSRQGVGPTLRRRRGADDARRHRLGADLIPHEFQRLFAQETFVWAGDLNTDPAHGRQAVVPRRNRRLFAHYEASGFRDTRARLHDTYQPTYGDYQIDHVFADARTEQRVTMWEVDLRPAADPEPYSDHAPYPRHARGDRVGQLTRWNLGDGVYQGTSLWIWAVQGFLLALCVAALVVAIGLALLAGAALVGLGWLAWRGWLALRDRRDPPVRVERSPSISGAPLTKRVVIPRYPGARPEDRS